MTEKQSFVKYQPEIDSIYEVVSSSLMGEYKPGMWLTESSVPINFSCQNCAQSTINLANPEYNGGELLRLSVKPVIQNVYRGSFPWTVQCPNCQGIYDIQTGWVEPNNGRMIVTLTDIREIKANPDIHKYAVQAFHWSGEKAINYLTNYLKYLLALEIELEGMNLCLHIENTIGRSKAREAVQLELFAPRYPDSATKIVSQTFADAAKSLLPKLSSRGSKMNTSFGIILSEVRLTYSSVSVPIPFLTASQNAQLSSTILKLLDEMLHAASAEDLKLKLTEAGFAVRDLIN